MEEKRENNNEIRKEKLKMALIIFNTDNDDFVYNTTVDAINQYYERNIDFDISIPLIISNFLLLWNPPYIIKRNFKRLVDWFTSNKEEIKKFREKDISSLEECEKEIKELFSSLCEILKPVATAKTLHVLAPNFFPLWDTEIARGYGFEYTTKNAHEKYFEFSKKIKEIVENIKQNRMIEQIINEIGKIKEIKVIKKVEVNDEIGEIKEIEVIKNVKVNDESGEIKEIEKSSEIETNVNICELIKKKSLLK